MNGLVIDPSQHKLGWALFWRNTIKCGVVTERPMEMGLLRLFQAIPMGVARCLIEEPWGVRGDIPVTKILKLAQVVGMVKVLAAQRGMKVKCRKPTQLPKQVTESRVRDALGCARVDTLMRGIPASYRHNAIDALHMGILEGWSK